METGNFGVLGPWRVYLLWATACTIMQLRCILSLNEEGELLLNWKQDYLEDVDDSLSNWNASDTSPCFWNGVQCTQGSVSMLDFSPVAFCNLAGDIHALAFAKFGNLTTLNVGNTTLSGNFPEDIVNCSKLVYLNLTWTLIGGNLPKNLSKLQHLQVLDLGIANLEGTVEVRFDELQELRVLRLGWNYFEGQMPESILSLTKLTELTLSHNNWNGILPLGFFTIPNLRVLWLGSDLDVLDMVPWPNVSLWEGLEDLRLHGVNFPPSLFPTQLLTLTKLRTLDLERCHIMGPIPSLKSLTHLEQLNLGNNSLNGHIPDMFGSMPNMTVLWLYQNQLIGLLPSSLLQCKRLSQLLAFDNGLSGDLAGLANLKGSLNWLDIGINNFSGEIPTSFENLTLLTFLALGTNNLSGEIPPIWKSLSLLNGLDLKNNNLSGKIPPILGTLSHLTYLNLGSNNLSGQIPPIWGNLSLLTFLELSLNHLSGSIPFEIANLEQLSYLLLQRNQLTGEIPYDLGRNTLLQWVDIGHNLFEGHVPPYLCWGNNVSLQFLGLYENRLTGTIPDTYGNCTHLRVLRLDGNQLEGPVPAGLWGGTNLVRMQLSGNRLSGSMDANIGNAKSLSILFVQDNQFAGAIPAGIGQTSLVKFVANSNGFNGTLPSLLGNLSSLTQLVLGSNSFHGAIPASLGNCSELFQLDLSRNHLDGAIPNELTNLNKLSTLDVSENNLTGTIPIGLFSMVNLQILNVAFNNLSGVLPIEGNGATFVTVNFTGNPYLCVEGSCDSNSSAVALSSPRDGKQAWIVVVGVFGVVALVLFVVLVIVFRRGKSNLSKDVDTVANGDMWTLTSFSEKIFHDREVTSLDEENVIGAGGSGKVYKVILSNGETVAVKKLWNVTKEESTKDHGFETEVRTLASLHHQHIVKLLCCCASRDCNLLVYEYMPKGSLGDVLHGTKAETLEWKIRYKIAVGVAMGLQYLHHECTPQILHRDIKSNNILLDVDFEAYLTDFGIAKIVDTATSHTLSTIAGSLGYMAPEYSFSARVNEKIDIYSFGVVLLELVTGKRAIDLSIYGEAGTNLVQWVTERVQTAEGEYEILDPNCERSSHEDMIALLRIGILCTSFIPARRPSMRDVVTLLGDIAPKSCANSDIGKDESEEGFHGSLEN